jgi:hypothetical protein
MKRNNLLNYIMSYGRRNNMEAAFMEEEDNPTLEVTRATSVICTLPLIDYYVLDIRAALY